MKIKFVLGSVLAAIGLMTTQNAVAQTGESKVRWKGNDYSALATTSGTEVFLYNVGTGRFLIHGGDWGTQSRLFYEDTGKLLTIKKGNGNNNIVFDTGMNTGGSCVLGCNIPEITSNSNNPWTNKDNTYTVMMDGSEQIGNGNNDPMLARGEYRNWKFARVAGTPEDVYTYYIYEDFGTRRTKYNKENSGTGTARDADYSGVYMGAAYGENWNGFDGDPNGPLVLQSSSFDKVTWSTVAPTSTTKYTCGVKKASLEGLEEGTTTVQRSMESEVPIFNVDTKVKLNELYQWRIVTKAQLLASMTNSDVNDGLSTNLTYLINDRGFERNDWSFFDKWEVAKFTNVNYSPSDRGNGRYRYTWGMIQKKGTSSGYWNTPTTEDWQTWGDSEYIGSRYVSSENYTYPVRLKAQWNSKTDAKYGFLEFEGIGTAYTYIDAPESGVYKVSCYGFYQGSNEGYLFATTVSPKNNNGEDAWSTETFSSDQKKTFKSVSGKTKNSNAGAQDAGMLFVSTEEEEKPYLREIEIHANQGDRIYFGVGKNSATRTLGASSYYYDSDWVGADQFQIEYLGTDEAKLLDEDKTVNFSDNEYLGESPYTNRTVRLHRLFQKNKWNSFVFPLDLSAVQVRNAFGQDARVAELKGIGVTSLSNNANILDFATVSLGAEDFAIEAGKFYLIMPTIDPTEGIASTNNKNYYTMGSFTFSGADLDAVTIDQKAYAPEAGSLNAEGHNHVKVDGTFFSSLNYEYASSNQEPDKNGVYVPAGSYVIGEQNKVYHTKSDLKTKGFRAWVVDVEAPSSSTPTAKGYSINGIYDENESTGIDNVYNNNVKIDNVVYDMSGRKVSSMTTSESLPKGLYIVNGKKYVVK